MGDLLNFVLTGALHMKKLKRCLLLLLAFCGVLSLAGCGSDVPANSVFSANDLSGKNIGLVLGTLAYSQGNEFKDLGGNVLTYNSTKSAAEDLKAGVLDCIIIDKDSGEQALKKTSGLKILDEPFSDKNFAICTAKENRDLLKDVNSALSSLRQEGVIDSLYDKYLNGGDYEYIPVSDSSTFSGSIRLAVDPILAPYEFKDGDNITGFEVDLARAICDKIGVGIEIVQMDRSEIINAVYVGKAELGIGCFDKNDESVNNVDFSDTYTQSTQVIIVRKK